MPPSTGCCTRWRCPAHLVGKPYLRPVYDHPQFIVRNVWRRYGGWYDGEPDNLLPAPRAEQAREWVALAGGVGPVLARADALLAAGSPDDVRLACHLVEHASLADPTSAAVHELRARRLSRSSRDVRVVDGPQPVHPRRAGQRPAAA